MTNVRETLFTMAQNGLKTVHGKSSVQKYLSSRTKLPSPIYLIAVGKAAVAMSEGAFSAWGDGIVGGLIITKYGHDQGLNKNWPITYIEASHPIPDKNSFTAGNILLDRLKKWPQKASLLFLISGGSSALMEVPTVGVSLAQVQQLNQWLLSSGLDVKQMNAIRSQISTIKKGGLLSLIGSRSSLQLLISDVPNNDPSVIGSAPLVAHVTELPKLTWPKWFEAYLIPSVPRVKIEPIDTVIVASNDQVCTKVRQIAAELDCPVVRQSTLQGDVVAAAKNIINVLAKGSAGLYVWGGETTVNLPNHPGRGGRNQHLALLLAQQIQNLSACCLCLATDGSDGPGCDSGAIVDSDTLNRGSRLGLDSSASLNAFDAGNYLDATGDLIHTGPTGTNVMDLVLVYQSKNGGY